MANTVLLSNSIHLLSITRLGHSHLMSIWGKRPLPCCFLAPGVPQGLRQNADRFDQQQEHSVYSNECGSWEETQRPTYGWSSASQQPRSLDVLSFRGGEQLPTLQPARIKQDDA